MIVNQNMVRSLTSKWSDIDTALAFGTLTNFYIFEPPSDKWEEFQRGLDLIQSKLQLRNANQAVLDWISQFRATFIMSSPDRTFALLETKIASRDAFMEEEPNLLEKTLLAFRLFKEGGIFLNEIFTIGPGIDSEIKHLKHFEPLPNGTTHYELKFEEIEQLTEILRKVQLIDFKHNHSIRIACDRFNKSYLNKYPEDKLIDLCIAFEVLFLLGEKQHSDLGMGQIIGLACSMLIGENKTERTTIFKLIEKGFGLRNKVVHGVHLNTNQISQINKIIPNLEEYLRRSILRLIP
jgi:hypothetical protein